MDQGSSMEDIICIENNNLFHIIDKEIKSENDTNIEVKVERLHFNNYESEVFDTEMFDTGVLETKVFETEAFETEVFETEVLDTGVFDTKVSETEALENFNIYKDHIIIKEELVVGPEIIQESFVQHTEDKISCGPVVKKSKSTSRTAYDCQQCTQSFKSNQARSRHYKIAHPTLTCKTCGKTFNKLSNLNRHINFVCPKNEFTIENNKVKKYGMYTHPFICDICKKTYSHKNTLRIHITKHLGIHTVSHTHTYKCHVCDKTYTKKHNLRCHITSKHSKLNLYKCKICNKGYAWRWSLFCHEKQKHCKN